MNIVVVGAGAIGKERIKCIKELGENLVAVIDPLAKIPKKRSDWNYLQYSSIEEYREYDNIDWVFVCTPHHVSPVIVELAIKNNCKVLVEKPLMANFDKSAKINVGFNYRYFKGVKQLLQDVKDNLFGELISVNMVLALGDPPGSEKTWRLDPEKAGRGAILDPGIHLIDLAMVMSEGKLGEKVSFEWRGYWNTGIWEESHILARSGNVIFNIQSSVNRWRNTFRIEVNGVDGYGIVEGRNRHYGNQTYRRGKRWGWQDGQSQKESEELVVDYDGEDSFLEETRAVLEGGGATHLDNERCLNFIK